MKIIDHLNKFWWGKPSTNGLTYSVEYEIMCKKCKTIYTFIDVRFEPSKCTCGSKNFFKLPIGKAFEKDKIL